LSFRIYCHRLWIRRLVDLTKKYIIFFFAFILILTGRSTDGLASETSGIKVEEISSTYVQGSYVGDETIQVLNGNVLLGQGKAGNNTYKIAFNQSIKSGTEITLKIAGGEDQTRVQYKPVTLNKIDDKFKVISGKIPSTGVVKAIINGQSIPLKIQHTDGNFEFEMSPLLEYGVPIIVVAEQDGVRHITTVNVSAAPSPEKPRVNKIYNTSTYISGYTEPRGTVTISAGKSVYYATASTSGYFRLNLPNNKPLPAGTIVSIKGKVKRHNGTSPITTLRVGDKIPPALPKLARVTNKSLVISGTTEANSTVSIYRNSRFFKTVKANTRGKFTIPMPLQNAGIKFELTAIDSSGNKSAKSVLVVKNQSRPAKKLIYAPIVKQMPELPRGCEVTTLTMMLNHAGVKANKMSLAKQVKKDPAPLRYIKGKKHFGNPSYGFVGDMYSFSRPGFGVFNKPIESLANNYMPGRIINLSGNSFDAVLNYVAAGRPVWVITTSTFNYVPSKYWQTWYTPQGTVRITMKEHSVLVTGYDNKYVYFNDPLDGMKNKKKPIKQFIAGWKQYGNQAISYF
jgi:uncharacterized protein YvpB